MRRWARAACSITGLLLVCLSCSSEPVGTATPIVPSDPPSQPIRVLMLTATAGFRHDSIAAARQVLTSLAASTGVFTITSTDDVGAVNASTLATSDVLLFALTSGELAFTADQKAAILTFVSQGRGFIGVHSATDTLYAWPEYGELVGAYFREHPWTQQATVIIEDRAHPTTSMLADRFSIREEFYTFRDNPRSRAHVLLRLDAASVGTSGDYPLAWSRSYGSGRVYYNALGHFVETWNSSVFQQQIVAAIRWAAAR
jgi:type 1 glutamine amidotransferase